VTLNTINGSNKSAPGNKSTPIPRVSLRMQISSVLLNDTLYPQKNFWTRDERFHLPHPIGPSFVQLEIRGSYAPLYHHLRIKPSLTGCKLCCSHALQEVVMHSRPPVDLVDKKGEKFLDSEARYPSLPHF
jgi:hypothetical protein